MNANQIAWLHVALLTRSSVVRDTCDIERLASVVRDTCDIERLASDDEDDIEDDQAAAGVSNG